MARIQGPDFPTAGFICGRTGIREAYRTGRGQVLMRARAEIETRKGDKESIVISEIPYQVNKANLIKKIAELSNEKRIDGIVDVRDESDRQGMRIVVDIRKGESSQVILNNLYKHTQLQDSFGVIMLAIVEQRPRVLNLLEACELFVDFRRDVVRRRTVFELRKAEARAHILEGFVIVLDHLDEAIRLIRGSKTPPEAHAALIARFALTEIQADEILKLQLSRLTSLERQKIVDELNELRALIADLKDILDKAQRVDAIVVDELKKLREEHGDARRTEIVDAVDEITVEDMIAEEDVAISITHGGYIKRTSIASYRAQRRGGRGRIGMRTKDEDFVSNIFIASTHSYILIFTDRGRVYWLKVHEVPEVGPQGKGKAVVNLVKLQSGEKIAAFCSAKAFDAGGYVLLATRNGIVKKTELSNFSNPRTGGIIALGVEDDDALIDAVLTSGQDQILLASRDGMAIRFSEEDVRPMGRTAYGVKGIELDEGDAVVALNVVFGAGTVLTVCENGYGKRTDIEEYRVQNRGGKGLINIKTSGRNGKVVGVNFLLADEGVMLITEKGMIIRLNTADISTIGRNTQGVRLIQLEDGDHLVSVARLAEKEEGEEPGSPDPS
jgi:DNA gyrase subunit A